MAKKKKQSGKPDAGRMTLAAGFPAPTDEAWQGLVERIVGSPDIEAALSRKTYDGLDIRPLYTARDWRPEEESSGFPGLAPFTRGNSLVGRVSTGWDIRQRHWHPDPGACNRAILEDLARGVTSVELWFVAAGQRGLNGSEPAAAAMAGRGGVMVSTIADLDEVLDGVYLDACPVSLRAGAAFLPAAAMFAGLLARRGVTPDVFRGAFNGDPLAALAVAGSLPMAGNSMLAQLGAFARHVADAYPAATAVAVDTTCYHDAGASEAQELACALATGTAYLRAMSEAGLDLDAAFGQIVFTFAVDANLFLSIAKLRALRKLWGRVAEACGTAQAVRGTRLHAVTSNRMLSRRDPWVNILRGTVAALAASVAGVDSLTVLPFTAAIGLPDAAARRIARNTQLVLQQESSLNRVIDPAGGAWAIENLTDAMAQEAWRLFQAIESEGGMLAALEAGQVQDRIAAVAAERLRRVGERSDPLTGTSAFPHLAEAPVAVETADFKALRARAARVGGAGVTLDGVEAAQDGALFDAMVRAAGQGASLGPMVQASARGPATEAPALDRWRLAEPFEALRDASDAYLERTGKRPIVYLATIGALARFTSAAAYAQNFLAAGGIDAVTGEGGTDAHAIAEAFRASGARTAVICSDKVGLADWGVDVAAALVRAGADEVFVIGRPGSLEAAGVKGFLYDGCDVVAVLRGMLERMGVLHG